MLAGSPVLRISDAGASPAAPSYSRRSRPIRENNVGRELSTTTLRTLAAPSRPERCSRSVRYSASAIFDRDSLAMTNHPFRALISGRLRIDTRVSRHGPACPPGHQVQAAPWSELARHARAWPGWPEHLGP